MDEYIDFGYDIGKDLQNAYNEGYVQGKADAVKHGRWIKAGQVIGWMVYDCVECSECKEDFALDKYDMDDNLYYFKYCPNCGAKMDAEG